MSSSGVRRIVAITNAFIILVNILGQAFPLAFPLGLPMPISKYTREFYEYVMAAAEKPDPIAFLDLSYTIGLHTLTQNEIVQYLTQIGIKWVGYSASTSAQSIIVDLIEKLKEWYPDKTYGVDYVFLGFIPGEPDIRAALLATNLDSITVDYKGTPRSQLPLLQRVHDRTDFDLFIACFDAFFVWARWWPSTPDCPSMVLIRSDSWPDFLSYYPKTFAAGLNAPTCCAEWEALTGIRGGAIAFSDGLSIVLIWTVLIIIGENIVEYYYKRSRWKKSGG